MRVDLFFLSRVYPFYLIIITVYVVGKNKGVIAKHNVLSQMSNLHIYIYFSFQTFFFFHIHSIEFNYIQSNFDGIRIQIIVPYCMLVLLVCEKLLT